MRWSSASHATHPFMPMVIRPEKWMWKSWPFKPRDSQTDEYQPCMALGH
mgnify:CR=1 FL=1